MTKDNKTKILIMLVLIVLATGITIVFATFSSSLNISSIKGTAQQGDSDVNFQNKVTFQNDANCTTTGDAYVTSAGTATGSSWSGIDITAKTPGDTITCTATIKNSSNYTAYITNMSTPNDSGFTRPYLRATLTLKNRQLIIRHSESQMDTYSAGGSSNALAVNETATATFQVVYNSSATNPSDDVVVTIPNMTINFSTVSN